MPNSIDFQVGSKFMELAGGVEVNNLQEAIKKALTMPLKERIRKWEALMQVVRDTDVGVWRDSYVKALMKVERRADDDGAVSAF